MTSYAVCSAHGSDKMSRSGVCVSHAVVSIYRRLLRDGADQLICLV